MLPHLPTPPPPSGRPTTGLEQLVLLASLGEKLQLDGRLCWTRAAARGTGGGPKCCLQGGLTADC